MDTYEKKYKKALEKVKIWQNHLYEVGDKDYADELNYIFPELKESEDERIRKSIIKFLIDVNNGAYTKSELEIASWIAWLDKQGEQKPNPYTGMSFEYNGHNWGMCARDNGVEIIFDGELKAFISSEKSFIYPIHPQPSLIPKSAQETISKEKVERQFRVGDWVVNNRSKDIFLIKCINSGYCTLEDIKGNIISPCLPQCESESHLWTIQDAKDGDVLSDGTTIFIFKDLLSDGSVMSYCDYDTDSGESDAFCPLSVNLMCSKITPTTKEQCDLLFQKMHEARYMWDSEKKELKNIEQNSAWSEEDDYNVQCLVAKVVSDIQNGNVGRNQELIDWFKSLKSRIQPKHEWSEEDDAYKLFVISAVEDYYDEKNPLRKELVDWLKSLKERL